MALGGTLALVLAKTKHLMLMFLQIKMKIPFSFEGSGIGGVCCGFAGLTLCLFGAAEPYSSTFLPRMTSD